MEATSSGPTCSRRGRGDAHRTTDLDLKVYGPHREIAITTEHHNAGCR
ncbi:MAG: hypothetical protein ABI112_10655 [Terracoccus sp.]